MEKIAKMLLEQITTGHLRGAKKWLVALALGLIIVSMLLSCQTIYKSRMFCVHGNDTIEMIHIEHGKLQKK